MKKLTKEQWEQKLFVDNIGEVLEFCGGDINAAVNMLWGMTVSLMMAAHSGNIVACSNHVERFAEGLVRQMRDENDPRDFDPKTVVH